MAERKTRGEEEFEAFERAKRALERKLEDIAWKHEWFLPRLEEYKKGLLKENGRPRLELEGE